MNDLSIPPIRSMTVDEKNDDFKKGFLETLSFLKAIDEDHQKRKAGIYSSRLYKKIETYVIETDKKIVTTASVFFADLNYNNCHRRTAFVEDVVTRPEYERKGLGKRIVAHIKEKAKENMCSEVILGCSDKNVPFYEKCGFKKRENQMRFDVPPKAQNEQELQKKESPITDSQDEKIARLFSSYSSSGLNYYSMEIDRKTVATAKVFIEPKYYGNVAFLLGDIIVSPAHQGKSLEEQLFTRIKDSAARFGCYKIMARCSDENIGLFEQMGFKKHENQMSLSLEE